jgi:hypothetical protein
LHKDQQKEKRMEVESSAHSTDRDSDFYSSSHEEIHYIRYIAYAALIIGVIFGGKLLLDEAFEGSSIIVGPNVIDAPSFLPTLSPVIKLEPLLLAPTLEPSIYPSFVPFNVEPSDDETKRDQEEKEREQEEKEREQEQKELEQEEKEKEKQAKKAEKEAEKKAKEEEKQAEEDEEEKQRAAAATLQPTSTHHKKSHEPTREPSIATTEQPSTSSPSFLPSLKPVKVHKTKSPTPSPSFAGTAISTASLAIFQTHEMKWDDLCLLNVKQGKSFLLQYDNETGDILADSSYRQDINNDHRKENEKGSKDNKGDKGKGDEKGKQTSLSQSSKKGGRHLLSKKDDLKERERQEREAKETEKEAESLVPDCSRLSYPLPHASSYERIRIKVTGTLANVDSDGASVSEEKSGGRGRKGQKMEPSSSMKYSFKNGNDFCQCTLDTSLTSQIDCTACQVVEGRGNGKNDPRRSSSSSASSLPVLKLTLDIKAFPKDYELSSGLMTGDSEDHSTVSLIALLVLLSTIFGLGYVMMRKKLSLSDDSSASSDFFLVSSFSSVLSSRNGYTRISDQETTEEEDAILA